MSRIIYKICSSSEWVLARTKGLFEGSPVDIQDGYIHFSTAAQVIETAAKHFAGKDNLVLIAVDAESLGQTLRWEPARGGELFPHLYDAMQLSAVLSVAPLPRDENGIHIVPTLPDKRE